MPRRKNSFTRALQDAEKRLEKALAERAAAQTKLGNLANEIPALQKTIAALRDQMEPSRLTAAGNLATKPLDMIVGMTIEEQAKWYAAQDLSTAGSIPPPRPVAPSAPVTEDDLLPDDFATGKR